MKPLIPGDRVCVKWVTDSGEFVRSFGVIDATRQTSGAYFIYLDGKNQGAWFFRTQIVRLKPKKSRQEFWLEFHHNGVSRVYLSDPGPKFASYISKCVHVIEVASHKGKKS